MKAWDALDENLKDAYAALPPPVRKASGFPFAPLENERLRLGRLGRQKGCVLDGKPEAFRTGGGKAAINQVIPHQAAVSRSSDRTTRLESPMPTPREALRVADPSSRVPFQSAQAESLGHLLSRRSVLLTALLLLLKSTF